MTALTGHILVADDEESIRWVLQTTLVGDGHTVELVETGDGALEKLTRDHFDVALVDIKMPGLDGLELLSKVREAELTTPIVIITAQNTMANAIEAMKRGAYDYVTKPFDIDEVRLLVNRVLEMRHQATELTRLEEQTRRRFELGVEIIGKTPQCRKSSRPSGASPPLTRPCWCKAKAAPVRS